MSNLFDRLFVLEMANNHMGDVDHGIKIIREMRCVCDGFDFQFAFKLQHRELDTFIHPDYKGRDDIKYVKRFTETRLNGEDFRRLRDKIGENGFIAVCTPFDERSVDLIEELDFDIIKIGSCSFTDWPLLERIVKCDKPIIVSTGGAILNDIDRVVSFFDHRNKKFALMHCVGAYPTGEENLQLNQISMFRERYAALPIGYSTHEHPYNYASVQMAIAQGALIFEKHVGVATDAYKLNAYSANPKQVRQWLCAARAAYAMCGAVSGRMPITDKEKTDLRGLQRGVFASRTIEPGERVGAANTFLAIPSCGNQLLAQDMSKYSQYTALHEIGPCQPVLSGDVSSLNTRAFVRKVITKMKPMLVWSKVVLPNRLEVEFSHPYGVARFDEWGAAIINCINREYCKKIIVVLPGQRYPVHRHKKKEETFCVMHGDLALDLAGEQRLCKVGEMVLVERGKPHSFSSKSGAIFEEISTTHYRDDSFFEDEQIARDKQRKTEVTFWADWIYKRIEDEGSLSYDSGAGSSLPRDYGMRRLAASETC